MTPTLEILIPAGTPGDGLAETAASLAAQTDRRFEVLLGENFAGTGSEQRAEAEKQLAAAGIAVRRADAPFEMKRLEYWNHAHSQARADWLKPLLPGEILKPEYVARLRRRVEEKPQAQFVRCDAELRTDWGIETVRAPFGESSIAAAQFGDYFPARVDWLCRAANVAYSRLAWLAAGGYSPAIAGLRELEPECDAGAASRAGEHRRAAGERGIRRPAAIERKPRRTGQSPAGVVARPAAGAELLHGVEGSLALPMAVAAGGGGVGGPLVRRVRVLSP